MRKLRQGTGKNKGTYKIEGCVKRTIELEEQSFFDGLNINGLGESGAGFKPVAPLIWSFTAPRATEAVPRPVENSLFNEISVSLRQANNPVAGGAALSRSKQGWHTWWHVHQPWWQPPHAMKNQQFQTQGLKTNYLIRQAEFAVYRE